MVTIVYTVYSFPMGEGGAVRLFTRLFTLTPFTTVYMNRLEFVYAGISLYPPQFC